MGSDDDDGFVGFGCAWAVGETIEFGGGCEVTGEGTGGEGGER